MSHDNQAVHRVSVTRCPVPTASSVAFDRGLLQDELAKVGATSAVLQDEKQSSLHEAHFNHSLPFLVREGGNIPALYARSTGRQTQLVGLVWVDEYQAILTRPDLPLAGPIELRGRRVGIPRHRYLEIDFRAAQALRGFHNALSLSGLSLEDVELVDIEVTRSGRHDTWAIEIDALAKGEVDAVFVKGATGLQVARTADVHEVVNIGFHPDPLVRVNNGAPRAVTVDAELLDHPTVAARVLTALLRAADWASSNEEELIRIIADETGALPEYVKQGYRNVSLRPALKEEWLDALDTQRKFLLEHGFLPSDFNVREWKRPEPLTAAEQQYKNEGVST